jgi:hypothetical protein
MSHGRNITDKQTRMRGNASRMSHVYKKERVLVGCEDVSCCALSLNFFMPSLTMTILSLIMPDLLMKKQQSSPRKSITHLLQLWGDTIHSCFEGKITIWKMRVPSREKTDGIHLAQEDNCSHLSVCCSLLESHSMFLKSFNSIINDSGLVDIKASFFL